MEKSDTLRKFSNASFVADKYMNLFSERQENGSDDRATIEHFEQILKIDSPRHYGSP